MRRRERGPCRGAGGTGWRPGRGSRARHSRVASATQGRSRAASATTAAGHPRAAATADRHSRAASATHGHSRAAGATAAALAVVLAVAGAHRTAAEGAPARVAAVHAVPVPGAPPADLPPEADPRPPGTGADAAAAPPGAGVPAPGARYAWPLLPPPAVVTPFRAPPHPYGRGHRGVDLAGDPGQPVLAARGGRVVFAGPLAGRGVVSVEHDDGLRTTYEPVVPLVAAGASVRAGAVLGALEAGHPGCPGTCLHWGVRRDRLEYLDPLVLLRPARVRLLPVPVPWPGG